MIYRHVERFPFPPSSLPPQSTSIIRDVRDFLSSFKNNKKEEKEKEDEMVDGGGGERGTDTMVRENDEVKEENEVDKKRRDTT